MIDAMTMADIEREMLPGTPIGMGFAANTVKATKATKATVQKHGIIDELEACLGELGFLSNALDAHRGQISGVLRDARETVPTELMSMNEDSSHLFIVARQVRAEIIAIRNELEDITSRVDI